jgi:hypothetical protein
MPRPAAKEYDAAAHGRGAASPTGGQQLLLEQFGQRSSSMWLTTMPL